jgi:MFS family permease
MLAFYIMSMWYKRNEAQRRFSFFVGGATFAGAFGGLLATAIGHMDGVNGYHAWRWIFILEGLATCVIAVIAFFAVTDFPEDAKWLTKSERAFLIGRLEQEQGESNLEEAIGFKGVLQSLSDVKTIVAGFMYFGPTMAGYSKRSLVRTLSFPRLSFISYAASRSGLFHPDHCVYVRLQSASIPVVLNTAMGVCFWPSHGHGLPL